MPHTPRSDTQPWSDLLARARDSADTVAETSHDVHTLLVLAFLRGYSSGWRDSTASVIEAGRAEQVAA
jgi:hypothetical protein